ncbi:DUF6381 family protein [Streptomyces sp. NPDC127084]|uniref:DUF6381 family protein n=1 Tax=Streptomyces sp. NPDC127084 TaxID=3347133 RepID=UPI003648F86C
MSVSGESRDPMRQKVQEMEQAAKRAQDPQERERLMAKARELREQMERRGNAGGDDLGPV